MLIFLRYLAKGDFQSECADLHGVSQPTVSRIISTVVSALDARLKNIIFPSTNEDIICMKTKFFSLAKFPGVIGAVDGTLIPILAPKEDEYAFVCRKGYHALNVQGVVDTSLRCEKTFHVHIFFYYTPTHVELYIYMYIHWMIRIFYLYDFHTFIKL